MHHKHTLNNVAMAISMIKNHSRCLLPFFSLLPGTKSWSHLLENKSWQIMHPLSKENLVRSIWLDEFLLDRRNCLVIFISSQNVMSRRSRRQFPNKTFRTKYISSVDVLSTYELRQFPSYRESTKTIHVWSNKFLYFSTKDNFLFQLYIQRWWNNASNWESSYPIQFTPVQSRQRLDFDTITKSSVWYSE